MPFGIGLSDINRYNPVRWARERIAPGESAREFWLGREYQPPARESPDLRLEGSEEQRQRLLDLYAEMGNYDPGYGDLIGQLRAQASGTAPGAGERAAGRAGERQLAAIRAQANTARGFGAGAARQQAMNQLAQASGQIAGQVTQAGVEDRQRALAGLMQATQEQSAAQMQARSMQLQALAAQMGISESELRARLEMERLRAAAAAGDEGAWSRLMGGVGMVAPTL